MRIFLLAVLLYGYLAIGAIIFQTLESTGESEVRSQWTHVYQQFLSNFSVAVKATELSSDGGLHEGDDDSNRVSPSHDHEDDYDDSGGGGGKVIMSQKDLDQLLKAYGEAIKAGYTGINNSKDRWDHMHSFHFAWTIVSTIGKYILFFFITERMAPIAGCQTSASNVANKSTG